MNLSTSLFFGSFPRCVEVASENDFLVRFLVLEIDPAVDCFECLDFLFFLACTVYYACVPDFESFVVGSVFIREVDVGDE